MEIEDVKCLVIKPLSISAQNELFKNNIFQIGKKLARKTRAGLMRG
jgi:hypothetical protein